MWREGDVTPSYPDDVVAPEHFELEDPADDDREDDVRSDGSYTEEELKSMNYFKLRKIAKQYGVFDKTMNTSECVIKAILGA